MNTNRIGWKYINQHSRGFIYNQEIFPINKRDFSQQPPILPRISDFIWIKVVDKRNNKFKLTYVM